MGKAALDDQISNQLHSSKLFTKHSVVSEMRRLHGYKSKKQYER